MTLTFGPHHLGIPQAIVLLDLHDDHGHSTADSELLVAASLLAELFHRGRLRIEGERVSLRAGAPSSRLLALVEVDKLIEAVFDRPVDVRAYTRLCPFGQALQQIFWPMRSRIEHH